MSRQEDFKQASQSLEIQVISNPWTLFEKGCEYGYQYARKNLWYDAQGDIVPEYDREVIVIRRNGEIGFGHRPNTKEVTIVEGKPYHAKTYDKNGWNWSDIALWLDVEIPHELEQITDKWFEENEQKRI